MIPLIKCKQQKILLITFLLLIIPVIIRAQTIFYVDSAAAGNNNGSNWTDAYNHLQDALSNAASGDEIWVAEGTYYPDEGSSQTPDDRESTFQLSANINIYGGFNGTEENLDQRNISLYETILSGDLQQDDQSGGDNSDNAYHVVTGATTTIDGFTITAGNANGTDPLNKGAGLYNSSASPDIYNCTFDRNNAEYGGAMANYTSSNPIITDCIFQNNTAVSDGGAIFNDNSNADLFSCTFDNNSANKGGALYNDNSSYEITNCIFINNSANQAGGGGALYNQGSTPALYNCTFYNNTASGNGDGIYNDYSYPKIINCIMWGTDDQIKNSNSGPIVTHSDIQNYDEIYHFGSEDICNIHADPLFRNAAEGNLLLQSGSPCLGTGTPVSESGPPTTDKDGRSRPLPATADSIDIGAYEQFDSDGSLPVELFLFSATCENGYVLLYWKTESEVDHQGFILERKETNGDYQKIASYETHDKLKSQGNTSSSTEYEFFDENVFPGSTYYYRLSDVSIQGHITKYPPISITLDNLPLKAKLDNAYPNPFNPQTYIGYHLPEKTQVRLTVVDMLGRKVKKLYENVQSAGNYHVYWNGKNNSGHQCPSGVYIIQLQTAAITKTKKVMLLK
ncbi:MAG: T9SS type A sorting domain-containing protein [bacterium]